MLNESLVNVPHLSLRVASSGQPGPPLLFLHGLGRGWRDWVPLVPNFTCRWQVLALDHRGHGGSDRTKRYLVADYVNDGVNVVRTLFREPGVLFGHSLGALVALGVAAQAPDLVQGVILEDPPSPHFVRDIAKSSYFPTFNAMRELAGPRRTVPEIARDLGEVRLASPDGETVRLADLRDVTSLRFSARCLQQLDGKVMTPVLEGGWLDGFELLEAAKKVSCPVLLLRGNETLGGMLPKADADSLSRTLNDCMLIDVVNVGHLIHWMAPHTTLRLVLGFLESLR